MSGDKLFRLPPVQCLSARKYNSLEPMEHLRSSGGQRLSVNRVNHLIEKVQLYGNILSHVTHHDR